MSSHEAAGAAITAYSSAVARHRAATERLDAIGQLVGQMSNARLAARSWKLSTDPDPRRAGGFLCGDGRHIMPHMWPAFDQIVETLKERDESAAARDAALAQLKDLGLNPADWK